MTLLASPTTATAAEPSVLEIERLEPTIGARVHGVDLDRATDEQIVAIRAALAEYKVLFFADQHDLHPDSQIALGRRLGELTESHPVVPGVDEDHPEIYALDSASGGFADIWHTDVTFVRRPPLGSVLRAVVLPPTGGDTQWADLELAYRSLSEPVQRLADQLVAVHDGTREFGYYLAQREERTKWEGEEFRALVPIEHPVVRVNPDTGRKGLFVNPGFVSHIKDVSDAESRYLLDLFYAHITKPEHIVRHRWSVGDVVMWDNRSTVHYANRDYGTQRRVMHRITFRGEEPVGPLAS
ncbi:TauD/TfdA family dioxygenase [Modestobacter sp. VKM Ac-2986]|uniref:TauD/TfdA dioxygenase family protein n=1 Tax=Modestobacter sp. VKM Ac-2986 TaxID=3004140 RepID=UPI0022AB2074|nr:TauD/TfdA family dioxygenase [Modestobacter sp. VKM Ac-2986]MCZ2828488.1 TauD/TfdA family dioxygenase [Modestobacter sp. VKM Ac-2986]